MLTARQREVADLISRGWRNPDIGKSLGISPETVKRHVYDICTVLGLDNRTMVAVWWTREVEGVR